MLHFCDYLKNYKSIKGSPEWLLKIFNFGFPTREGPYSTGKIEKK